MLDGITVLDIGTKVVSYTWGWSWAAFIWTFIGFIAVIVSIICLVSGDGCGGLLVVGSLIIAIGLFIFSHAAPAKIISTYKVIIDDSVSMVAFYNKYEVLNVEGKIYTIIEREDLK